MKMIYLCFLLCTVTVSCSSTSPKNPLETEEEPSDYFESSFGKIAYYTKGKGPKLILLHAAGHDHRDFDAILPALISKYQVISLDWPGHGKSEWSSSEEISAVFFPTLLREFLEKKAPEGSILMGNSIGGYASLKLALEQPNLVKGLILVDTGGMNELDISSKAFIKLKSNIWFTSMIWNFFPKFYTKIENVHTNQMLDRIKKAKLEPKAVETNASLWKSFLDENYNLRNFVSQISQPTLIVWGKNDPVIYPKFGRDLHDKISDSEFELLDTGHIPFAEDPERFLQILFGFLSKRNL
ncbi:alpha/beta fold hydrolase [Leptospira ognonensis]|nr:alpha/beta hydrolase [Leptospira ognonensis]